jgi:hypothetical protein
MPNNMLEDLAKEASWPDSDETLDEALEWASGRRFGVTGFLTLDEDEEMWRVAGTLVADTVRSTDAEPISLFAWGVAFELAPSEDDALTLNAVARADLRERGEAGDGPVMEALWALAEEVGDHQDGCLWAKRLAQADPADSASYCEYLARHGFFLEAVHILETAAQDGSRDVALALAALLRDRADHWDRVASAEQPDTVKE